MPLTMTAERIAQARERCEKATKGPWYDPWDDNAPDDNSITAGDAGEPVVCVSSEDAGYLQVKREDAAFIAAARTDLPAALADLALYQAVVESLMVERRAHARMAAEPSYRGDDAVPMTAAEHTWMSAKGALDAALAALEGE